MLVSVDSLVSQSLVFRPSNYRLALLRLPLQLPKSTDHVRSTGNFESPEPVSLDRPTSLRLYYVFTSRLVFRDLSSFSNPSVQPQFKTNLGMKLTQSGGFSGSQAENQSMLQYNLAPQSIDWHQHTALNKYQWFPSTHVQLYVISITSFMERRIG